MPARSSLFVTNIDYTIKINQLLLRRLRTAFVLKYDGDAEPALSLSANIIRNINFVEVFEIIDNALPVRQPKNIAILAGQIIERIDQLGIIPTRVIVRPVIRNPVRVDLILRQLVRYHDGHVFKAQ